MRAPDRQHPLAHPHSKDSTAATGLSRCSEDCGAARGLLWAKRALVGGRRELEAQPAESSPTAGSGFVYPHGHLSDLSERGKPPREGGLDLAVDDLMACVVGMDTVDQ